MILQLENIMEWGELGDYIVGLEIIAFVADKEQ